MAKLRLVLSALALFMLAGVASLADDPVPGPCETSCGTEFYQYCICPEWTDRRGEESACGNWETVGGCWYE
jgi:hypothetical protein